MKTSSHNQHTWNPHTYRQVVTLLVNKTGSGPNDGGCYIVAKALQNVLGGTLAAVKGKNLTNYQGKTLRKSITHHCLLKVSSTHYLDMRGLQTKAEIINAWRNDELVEVDNVVDLPTPEHVEKELKVVGAHTHNKVIQTLSNLFNTANLPLPPCILQNSLTQTKEPVGENSSSTINSSRKTLKSVNPTPNHADHMRTGDVKKTKRKTRNLKSGKGGTSAKPTLLTVATLVLLIGLTAPSNTHAVPSPARASEITGGLEKTAQPQLVNLKKIAPTLVVDLQYTKGENITGKPLYPKNATAWADKDTASALANAERALNKSGYGITVLDAWRPTEATRRLWNKAIELHQTDFYAPPALGSSHNRGAAVDVGLHKLSNPTHLLPMPMAFDETDFSRINESEQAQRNNHILRNAMVNAGFIPHKLECWHYAFPPSEKKGVVTAHDHPPFQTTNL
jgi:D-alanyl-D-alanine dipeptidase